MKNKIYSKAISISFGVIIILFLTVFYISAWTDPTAVPPGGNVSAPINVGGSLQAKEGVLVLQRQGLLPSLETHGSTLLSTNSGMVGIGTTNPTEKLDLNGNFVMTGYLNFNSDENNIFFNNNGSGNVYFWQNGIPFFEIDSAFGNLIFRPVAGTGEFIWQSKMGNNTWMTLSYEGKLGIGTENPQAQLEVVGGPIKATGGFILETRNSDVSNPETGQMWLRTDINP